MEILKQAVARELASASGFARHGLDEKKIVEFLGRPPKAEMGDLALGCFKPAKELGLKPNELAAQLAQGVAAGALVSAVTAAGPYVNLRLNRESAAAHVLRAVETSSVGQDPRQWRFGNGNEGNGRTLVVDLSSPNIAKPLAVHHLRSTMIGYAIKRIREAQGWRVVGINHLGDWGTGFGKLIAGLKKYFPAIARRAESGDPRPLGDMSVAELNAVYARFSAESRENEELAESGRAEFALLEQHIEALVGGTRDTAGPAGEANFRIWQHTRDLSLAEFERMYTHLGLSFAQWPVVDAARARVLNAQPDDFYREHCLYIGESYYVAAEDLCRRIIADAVAAKVAEESEGAIVIYTHGKDKPPLMLVKADGATSYHVRDLAAAVYRQRHWHADELCYVVGGEQKLHFEQLFRALALLGHRWAAGCSHVDFGLMMFQQPDGKWAKTSTRRGTAIMLEDLLDEAVRSVREIMAQKNPELAGSPDAERIARAVGVGAVVFNDLKNGRRNNVKFDWDAVLDFEGESGPYMQYQFVRMGSVLEKYREKYGEPDFALGDPALLSLPEEWAILQQLADFPAAVERASREFEPSIVARALIDLAGATSTWWTITKDTRIVGDNPNLSLARVRLVDAVRKVLGRGLTLLGMNLVERM
ncbi:MAG: arginine--tRNA ligase [Planctomycetes bacterium]|nr:arginine--tRNA ligase [Planctomycetota bacterium]MCL4729472.1 arginine--tRNA ligase [Planctomycetota bacterium]